MKKKVLALVLVLALVAALTVGLVACNGDGEDEYNLPSLTKSTIKIGVLHINPTDSDSGYTAAHESGIKEMIKSVGIADTQVIRKGSVKDTVNADIKTAIEDLIAEGCNVIIGTSFGYQQVMSDLAKEYKNVYFSHGSGYMSGPNMNNYFGRIYQARYLSGVVAGLKSLEIKNNEIGYVSAYGTTIAETSSGINAFALGAQSVNPEAVVNVQVLGAWYDEVNESGFADSLLDSGCGIVTQHCDTEGPSSSAAAKEKFSIGYNTDMRKAINSESVLTSVVWHWGVYYTKLINAILDGEWATLGNYYGEYKDGLFGLTELSNTCAADTQKYLDAVTALMLKENGRSDWDVFSGKKLQFNKDTDGNVTVSIVDSALLDNADVVRVAAGGGSVADSVITGNMPYFVKGVQLIGTAN